MTELLDKAIRLLETLPDSDQDAAASVLLDYMDYRDNTRLTDAQIAEVRRRITDPNRIIVTEDDARSRIDGFGS